MVLFLAALFYDYLPVHPPACGFRTVTGLPCVGCGGTRAMRSLAAGHLVEALRYNPGAILAFFASLVWGVVAYLRYFQVLPAGPTRTWEGRRRRLYFILSAVITLLVLNWIYLLIYLP